MGEVTEHAKNNRQRRQFLRQSVATTAVVGLSSIAPNSFASALTAPIFDPDRELQLVNIHTWEQLDVVYWSEGRYIPESLQKINHLMRDHRAGVSTDMDVRLIDDLYHLYGLLNSSERIHVLSGFRTKATNAKLRMRTSGVAKYSLHMEGRALDISLPGRSAQEVRSAALSMNAGGVGYYAASGFVHIDTGAIRNWSGS